MIGGGDWGADRLVPDVMRAALAGRARRRPQPERDPPLAARARTRSAATWCWRSGCGTTREPPTAWNFGPAQEDARPVGWIVERLAALWPGELAWERDAGEHPHEARYLKVDSSRARGRLGWTPRWDLERALASIVEWYAGMRDGADMRALTLRQLADFSRPDGR